jgi:hypothetical protein
MWLWNIGVLIAIALGVWWLTGLDRTSAGESKRGHYLTRALRCLVIVLLVAVFLWFIQGGGGAGGAVLLLIVPVSIALVLRSSLAEVFSQGFLRMMDPAFHDDRELDFKKDGRYLDAIAHLIHHGRKDDAIRLCQELKQGGELDAATLDMTLAYLGVNTASAPVPGPLHTALQLRLQGDNAGAAVLLQSLVKNKPDDLSAAMLLMRVYAQDLRQPDKAREILRALEQQRQVSPAHLDFARRSIDEWSQAKPPEAMPSAPAKPRSLEELLADKAYGSAVETLEQCVGEQPGDFASWLKLAEVHALCCHNLPRAEKIVRQMEAEGRLTEEQTVVARGKLKEWREIAAQRK